MNPALILTFARSHWKLIALALFAAWAFRVNHLRGHYKALAASEKAAHAQTVANYTNAQKAAQALFDAKIKAMQLRNKELNDEASRRASDLTAQYHDRVMRLPKAAACHTSGTGLPATDISERADRPGGDTVLLERADALICSVNTARLQAVHDWAINLGNTQ